MSEGRMKAGNQESTKGRKLFLKIFFYVNNFLKDFIEFVKILLLFYVFVFCLQRMWDLSLLSHLRPSACWPELTF